jgi:hypothetical protein
MMNKKQPKIRCEVCHKRAANCLVRYHPLKWADEDDAFWKFTCDWCIDSAGGVEHGIIAVDQCRLRNFAAFADFMQPVENPQEFLAMLVRAHLAKT